MKNKKNNSKNNILGKSKVLPTLIIIIISFIILTICGMAYCGSMIDILRGYKNSNYNSMSKIDAQNLTNTINTECQSIESYANEISSYNYESINTYLVRGFLANMVVYNGYSTMYIINADGKGFDYLDNSIDLSQKEYFKTIDYTKQTIINQDDKFIYITPAIDENNQFKFFIIAETTPNAIFEKVSFETWNDMGFYLLDNNKNVIAYGNNAIAKSTYDEIIIGNNKQYNPNEQAITKLNDLTLSKFISSIKGVLFTNDIYPIIWYEHSLQINDWTILIGRSTINQDTDIEDLLYISVTMLGLILATLILMLIIFMIKTIHNNYKIKKVLYLDTLTGGTNWLKFKHDATKELQKGKNIYALVSFDIYKFRLFCDINGHKKGNEVLIEIDRLMKNFIRKKEYYAHNTSDTFDMFLIYENDQLLKERLKRFSEVLSKSEKLNNLCFAFGVYVVDNKNISINRMSTMANMAKDNSRLKDYNIRETISFFTKEMHDKTIKETEILNDFNSALEKEQFLLFVQPKYNLMTDTLSAGEALVRWKKDENFISPAEFIPIFEKNGCIRDLDKYMLEAVCKKQRQWLDNGFDIVPISVNLSRACFSDTNLVKSIVRLVDSYQIPHKFVELEVTESAFFDNKRLLIDTVQKLKNFGFSVSIDDFGAGYSSLNSLKELPIDIVKIDGGFFRDIANEDKEKSNIIVYNTIRLAHELNLKVVAEGVETDEQINFLRSLGYDMLIQSYYYSKPIPNADFETLLKNPVGNPHDINKNTI